MAQYQSFNSAQLFLNYYFDDNLCFFADEIKAVIDSIGKIDVGAIPLIDTEQIYSDIIFDLFKIYETLIVDVEEEKLYGEIGGKLFFIKEAKRE